MKKSKIILGIKIKTTYNYYFNIYTTEEKAICKLYKNEFKYEQRYTGTKKLFKYLEKKHNAVYISRKNKN